MKDEQLLRYNRQILLQDVDLEGQQKILDSHVAIVGLGGLGSPVAMYLAGAGVGTLSLVDFDDVDISNLHRQILFDANDISHSKAESAKKKVLSINPYIAVTAYKEKLDKIALREVIANADAVVDCTDNFAARDLINLIAFEEKKVLVSGAAIGMEGQLCVFNFKKAESPCYRCLYSEGNEQELNCSSSGVLGPVVGVIGSLQALETIKLLVNNTKVNDSVLTIWDARTLEWRSLKLVKDEECQVCSK